MPAPFEGARAPLIVETRETRESNDGGSMKAHLAKLSLALMFTVFLLGCQDM